MSIAEALAETHARIAKAAASAGREPGSIRLVAVSKTKPAAVIREAYAAGQRDFGENYAQELSEKAAQLADLVELRWHFIGHLQSNKAKLVAPVSTMVQTVDSASLATALARRLPPGKVLEVLVEVNVGGEEQKHGATPADLPAILDAIRAEPSLSLRGLMTVPPSDLDLTRRAFETLAKLRTEHALAELSMGMSADLELAVAAGATIVRVGSAIFGSR